MSSSEVLWAKLLKTAAAVRLLWWWLLLLQLRVLSPCFCCCVWRRCVSDSVTHLVASTAIVGRQVTRASARRCRQYLNKNVRRRTRMRSCWETDGRSAAARLSGPTATVTCSRETKTPTPPEMTETVSGGAYSRRSRSPTHCHLL